MPAEPPLPVVTPTMPGAVCVACLALEPSQRDQLRTNAMTRMAHRSLSGVALGCRRRRCGVVHVAAVPVDRAEQVVEIDGLFHELGDAHCARFRLRGGACRENDDGNLTNTRVILLRPPERRPRHPRHHHVEQDDTGSESSVEQIEGLLAVESTEDVESVQRQQRLQGVAEITIILDDEHRMMFRSHRTKVLAARI